MHTASTIKLKQSTCTVHVLTASKCGMRLIVLLSIVCALVSSQHDSQSQSFCQFDLDDIKRCISMGGEAVTHFVLNCLAAHNSSFAESISLSAFTGEDDGVRYDFQCYEGTTLIRTTSTNISNVAHHVCSSCQFNLSDPCVNDCSDRCNSCPRNQPDNCTSCHYLVNHTNDNDVNCLENTSCAMLGFKVGETGCECPVGHYLKPKETEPECLQPNKKPNKEPRYLLPNREVVYHCVSQCNCTSTKVDEDDVCYACGIEKCIECTEGRNGEDECICCVKGYSPYHNHDSMSECIPLMEKQTKLLEEFEEEKVTERESADLLLVIFLPLCCVLTVVFFVGMSVFAHFYFPYIDTKGEKRHKRRPLLPREHTAWEPHPNINYR